ncbi:MULTISPECIES: hypothetical protein [Sphingobium]|uniref:Uncharacterized protein n=1 Tax=Sphingobium lignivorans TaxID=2735886 RepID=A0ABR6NG38_9SPHN|nr:MULTISPECIES: hypothetical protein [Sphingobium]MBB5986249.1 putative protein kinase ArgK-like GTPase of G3E family [Sphingobium lignivorans]BAK67012.1 hypothetical protein SLG_23370 [Sphingobium sp. SYK-6]
MASDAMMQAIGRLERAITRAETLARQVAEQQAQAIEAQLAQDDREDMAGYAATPGAGHGSELDPFSRDKAIAALKSLDALIGDLQKARSEA